MLNLQFRKIILHCFGSYAHAELDLQNRGFCLVSGKNEYVADNAASNGSGKSFIWSGICYALTGETIGGITKDLKNIHMSDEPEMYVEVYFTADGHEYVIKRGLSSSNVKSLSVTKDDNSINGKTFSETSAKLSEALPELTKDLIANTIIIGQGMPSKFSSFSPSGRKELLEKLTKSDYMIEDIKNRVATRLAEITSNLRTCEDSLLVNNTQLTAATNAITALNKQIAEAKKPNYADETAIIKAELESKKNNAAAYEQQLSANEKLLDQLSAELFKKTSDKASQVNQLLESYHGKSNELNTAYASTEAEYKAINKEIVKLESIKDTCPTCGRKLEGVEKPDTTALHQQATKLSEQMSSIKADLTVCADKYKAYNSEIEATFAADLGQLSTKVNDTKHCIAELKTKLTTLNSEISALGTKADKLEYEAANWDNWFNNLVKSVKPYEEEAVRLTSMIDLVKLDQAKMQEHLAVIKKIETLIKRDFRGYLLSNIISYLDKKAKDYSDIVYGTRDLSIYLDGNNLNISYGGRMMDNLSGGEKTRVDLILQLSIRDMLQSYLNFNSNILVLDEITDFLDKQSCKAIMNLISKELTTVESVFIISHHPDELELPIDSELYVVKDGNGISSIA